MRKVRKSGKLVCGVGVNDADYSVSTRSEGKHKWCPFYSRWKKMIERCYDTKFHQIQPTYADCSVAPEWHYFMTFKIWMQQQDWNDKHLDKDLLLPNNKIYSADTCIFLESKVNNFLTQRQNHRGDTPIGVYRHQKYGLYVAECWNVQLGRQEYLGTFKNTQEAHEAWLSFKLLQAKILAAEQTDRRVAAALVDRYENYAKYFPQPT